MAYWLDKKAIITVANQLRNRGKKIVFTHGCFDLFHIGHLGFLELSKKQGDILIVGVDSDLRVKKYKNVTRPVIPQENRLQLVAGIKDVDFVFLIQNEYSRRNNYFRDLYQKINPNLVTFGRNFPFKSWFKIKQNHLEEVKYREIKRLFKHTPATTKIINQIKNTHFQN